MLKRKTERRLVEAAKITAYHGTATGKDDDLLRRILKHGLEADPRKRRYEAPTSLQYDDSETKDVMKQRELEFVTYGGTYLTSDLAVALGYAQGAKNDFGGEMLMVVARIETRSPEITIDEDQFISSVNLRSDFFRNKYEKTLNKKEYSFTSNSQYYDALMEGSFELTDKDIQEFLNKWLSGNRINVVTTTEDLMRYRDVLHQIFLLHAEFEAATDFTLKDDTKYRNPADIASDFRDVVNTFTKKIGKLADPVEDATRNVRSFEPVGYKGANRIVGILAFDPEEGEGIVAYGADAPETKEAAARINSILGTKIHYTSSRSKEQVQTPRHLTTDLEDYTEILIEALFQEVRWRLNDRFGYSDRASDDAFVLSISPEKLAKEVGLSSEEISEIVEHHEEEIESYVEDHFDSDDADMEKWANRLGVYVRVHSYAQEVVKCLNHVDVGVEVDDSFFEEVVAPYVLGNYGALHDAFHKEEQVEVIERCSEAGGGEDLFNNLSYELVENAATDRVNTIVEEWFEEEYPELQEEKRMTASLLRVGNKVYRKPSSSNIPPFEELWELWLEGDPWEGRPLHDEMLTLKKFMRGRPEEEVAKQARENLERSHSKQLRRRYENSIAKLDRFDGQDCWRAVELDKGVDPTTVDPLGTYWATTRGGAGTYWGVGGDKQHVVYRGRVDSQYVDTYTTVLNNALYPDEYEVSFLEGSPIYVYDVTLGGAREYTFPIKAMRTC